MAQTMEKLLFSDKVPGAQLRGAVAALIESWFPCLERVLDWANATRTEADLDRRSEERSMCVVTCGPWIAARLEFASDVLDRRRVLIS
ncbi:hypothetical protein ITJ38_17750 [Agreia pratensis]|uniref:hypothetical protein n=1 Tax=Agreia pratensis TaxID=150121 RepID=UPI00188D1462|nr:hypothetical protein [Agreia pratensis]MBF4636259.1 hypothetical protein [Agreia pratensis]